MIKAILNAFKSTQLVTLRKPSGAVAGRPIDVVAALFIFLGAAALVSRSYISGPATVSLWGLQGFVATLAVSVLAVTIGCIILRREKELGATLVVLTMSMCVSTLLIGGIWFAFKDRTFAQSYTLFWVLGVAPVFVALCRQTATARWYQAWSGAVLFGFWLLASIVLGHYYGQSYIFEVAYDTEETTDYDYGSLADPEVIYPQQADLLGGQLTDLEASADDQADMFVLLGAGTPNQSVFQREIDHLETLAATRFDAQNRTIKLGPTVDDPLRLPLLNRTNLTQSLNAISNIMDPAQDLVFIFLTSHGGRASLSTYFPGLNARNLSSAEVAQAIDQSGVANVIIVVSACYSGSFVDELEAPDRLVLTASAADRSSFGCADTNTFTDWGTAFFDALEDTLDFHQAALRAQATVATEEAERGYEASLPQIAEGEAIGEILEAWVAARLPN
ncbi:C13 family peptidase [Yoonia sp. F2084L]|uniref:C13 family peptidase n=1 Tax=Yoonia sp. F2084L TaxID=2926419 RepID=UPI001FF623B3|nr:C13 family peptidase [Yoonia sp. F2084L]MCK0096478.1 C13 family peptidase [Yoonia sp. F2084L]